jgi:hypothetical protein
MIFLNCAVVIDVSCKSLCVVGPKEKESLVMLCHYGAQAAAGKDIPWFTRNGQAGSPM